MTNCERCGANLAMVGRVHRCMPVAAQQAGRGQQDRGKPRPPYKYRDADKWREYMRGYMRAYRARKRNVRGCNGEASKEAGQAESPGAEVLGSTRTDQEGRKMTSADRG